MLRVLILLLVCSPGFRPFYLYLEETFAEFGCPWNVLNFRVQAGLGWLTSRRPSPTRLFNCWSLWGRFCM